MGKLVAACEQAAELLSAEGVEATVWDARVVAPLDQAMIADASAHRLVVSVEDGIADGGIGWRIESSLAATTLRCSSAAEYRRHIFPMVRPQASSPSSASTARHRPCGSREPLKARPSPRSGAHHLRAGRLIGLSTAGS